MASNRFMLGFFASLLGVVSVASAMPGDAKHLAGIHWWGHTHGQPVDAAPKALLDVPTYSAWDTETVLTHSADWWKPWWFADLYTTLYSWNVTPITRVDYTWDDTIPPPSDPNASGWPNVFVTQVVDVLRHGSHLWIVGNEPNLLQGPSSLWPNRRIQPADYAKTYRAVRKAVHEKALVGAPGNHLVLIAGPSPGGIEGPRWMSGNTWLKQVLAAIPANEVDGLAIHAYGWGVSDFAQGYREQLAVIDAAGLSNKPVWISEFNRFTQSAADEANSASFVRQAFANVHEWNQIPGNHNIVGMTWFVHDGDNQAGGGWNGYSLEYWKTHGYPEGDSRDLYTAFRDAVANHYPAGRWGGVPVPRELVNGGFESGNTNGWTTWGRTDGVQAGPWFMGIQPRSGQYFFGSAANWDYKNGGLFQRAFAVKGRQQMVSAYIRTYKEGGAAWTPAEVRLGIDPSGGIDPASLSVVWSPWQSSQGAWKRVSVSATALDKWITVFVQHRQPGENIWNITCVDDVARDQGLVPPPKPKSGE